MSANLICESPATNVRVARFLRPDLRPALYDHGTTAETTLYKELHAGAIADLPGGGTLVLNFGLVDWFPTVFYSLLLQALQDVRARNAHLALCCLTPNVKEGFELMGGGKLFEVHTTEGRALSRSKH